MHDQVGACKKLDVAAVFPEEVADAGGKRTRMRFVIGRIDKGDAARLKPVAQGERRVIEVAAGNLDVANPQPSLDELAITNCGAELLKGYGKVGRLHLARQGLSQALAEAVRRVDVPFKAGNEKWLEKWDTLNVIPVGVADQNMTA